MAGKGLVKDSQDSHALQSLNDLDQKAEAIIDAIPGMDDDQLLDLRSAVIQAGKACWRIEIAADYEIRQRLHARRGRGNIDTEGVGVKAALAERAAELGLSIETIKKNAQIHKVFFASENGVGAYPILEASAVLKDKTFFAEALRADDPHKAVIEFAEKKRNDPLFSTRAARREVEEIGVPSLDDIVRIALVTPEAQAAWEEYKRAVRGLKAYIPMLSQILDKHVEELEHELSRPAQAISERVIALIRDGFNIVDELTASLRINRVHCQVILKHLLEQKRIGSKEAPRHSGARGQVATIYYVIE